MTEKYIIYTGNFDFSEKIAAGKRVLGISYALRDLGYKVILVGCDTKTPKAETTINTKQIIDGFDTYMLPYPQSKKDWVSYNIQFNRLINLLEDLKICKNIHSIIIYGCPCLSLWGGKLLKWSKKNNIKFITDVVDWMPANRGSLLFRLVKWADTAYLKRYLNSKADSVIAVSKYLTNYYKSKDCNVITIPPITDTSKFNFEQASLVNPNKVKFIYVGMPFALDKKNINKGEYKDRLDLAIKLLVHARKNTQNFIFNIYGITKEEYLSVLSEDKHLLEEASSYIIFHGRISNKIAMKNIHESDFTILIRDINRMTTSGFPTKVSESISCGTPVITTRTSDIEDYMTEGKNGFFLSMINNKIQAEELIEIVKKPRDLILEMKEYCYNSKLFDYRNYNIKLGEFLDKI